jgi:hypothetical protein
MLARLTGRRYLHAWRIRMEVLLLLRDTLMGRPGVARPLCFCHCSNEKVNVGCLHSYNNSVCNNSSHQLLTSNATLCIQIFLPSYTSSPPSTLMRLCQVQNLDPTLPPRPPLFAFQHYISTLPFFHWSIHVNIVPSTGHTLP